MRRLKFNFLSFSRYQDPEFKEECTKQYLEERKLYRIHGDKKPMKAKESEMF